MRKYLLMLSLSWHAFLILCLLPTPVWSVERPKLVVMITIDQLRGDMPWRFKDRFGEKGFRYLLDNGTWYCQVNKNEAKFYSQCGVKMPTARPKLTSMVQKTGYNNPEVGIYFRVIA